MTYSNECLNVVGQVRVNEDTFTGEEVEEIVEAVEEAAASEVEAELLNSAHTNILLLKQLFSQAEKWHLNLDTDMSELENRDLLDAVKQWEERELMGGKVTSVQCCSVEVCDGSLCPDGEAADGQEAAGSPERGRARPPAAAADTEARAGEHRPQTQDQDGQTRYFIDI